MQGLKKSKKVSWASDSNLCQVRLFLLEDSPSQVGVGAQDHLQAKKTLSASHPNILISEDNLPPGFEGFNPANEMMNKLGQISLIKWQCPPKFILDVAWQVVDGEESKEVEILNQRELRVLEAIYPRQSAIPLNPAISPDVETNVQNDQNVPLIPVTPIEEEDPLTDPSPDSAPSVSTSSSNQSGLTDRTPSSHNSSPSFDTGRLASGIAGNGQQDMLKTALTAIAKNNEQIDHDLLVKILGNPTILEQLVRLQGTNSGSSSVVSKPMECVQGVFKPTSSPAPQFSKVEASSLYPNPYSNVVSGPLVQQKSPPPVPRSAQVTSIQSGPPAPVKDLNYYKNLIHQHGDDRQQLHHPGMNQNPVENSKHRDGKPKSTKPCIYFNSSKGCRNGTSCIYQHDVSFQPRGGANIPETPSAKRAKMEGEIRGSQ